MAGPDHRGFECQGKSLDLILEAESLRDIMGGASSVWLVMREHHLSLDDALSLDFSLFPMGSGQGPTWGRREKTKSSLKGAFAIYWSKFFSTMGQNS